MQHINPENIPELVEFSEAEAWVNYYNSSPADSVQQFKVVAKQIRSAWVIMMARLESPLFNRIMGLGIRNPTTEAELDQAIDVFNDAGCKNFMIQISPSAQPSQISEWLDQRGFKRGRNWAKMYRGNEAPLHVQTDLRVKAIGSEYGEDFSNVVLNAFEMPQELGQMVQGPIGKPGWHHYLAFDQNEAASAGAMYVSGEIAWLGFGSTLASHRKRGGQGAIFARRITDGLKLGCKWFVTETGEDTPESPNPSFHNMVRHGFKLAYLRSNYIHQEEARESNQSS